MRGIDKLITQSFVACRLKAESYILNVRRAEMFASLDFSTAVNPKISISNLVGGLNGFILRFLGSQIKFTTVS